jgi:hypothetical protein
MTQPDIKSLKALLETSIKVPRHLCTPAQIALEEAAPALFLEIERQQAEIAALRKIIIQVNEIVGDAIDLEDGGTPEDHDTRLTEATKLTHPLVRGWADILSQVPSPPAGTDDVDRADELSTPAQRGDVALSDPASGEGSPICSTTSSLATQTGNPKHSRKPNPARGEK